MILKIRHKGLERLYRESDPKGVPPQQARKLQQILGLLDVAQEPGHMRAPGLGLHPLKGDRKGQWAVWVTGNWRVVFRFEGVNATDVELVDYHQDRQSTGRR